MVTWPASVPYYPLADSFQIQAPYRAPLVTDYEDGNSRGRPSTTKNIARVAFRIVMTHAQFETFKVWVRDTLFDGTLSFSMKVFTDAQYLTRTCTLVERTYQAEPVGGRFHAVTLTLDVEDY